MFQRRTFSCLQKAFDSASLPSKSALKTGLFGYNNLSSPIDYQTIVDIRIKQADKLVELITSGTADKTVQRIDRVSDLICSVVGLHY